MGSALLTLPTEAADLSPINLNKVLTTGENTVKINCLNLERSNIPSKITTAAHVAAEATRTAGSNAEERGMRRQLFVALLIERGAERSGLKFCKLVTINRAAQHTNL